MTRTQKAIIAAALLVFCVRALEVGAAFNHTFDEPTQISSGLELWQYGTFTLHSDVPPLAKLLIAAPAHFTGVVLEAPPDRGDWKAANRALYGSGEYWFVLRSARAVNTAVGVLLIVALTCYTWTVFGGWAAAVAAIGAASSPGLVSAASIANSDILGVLTVLVTFYTFRKFLQTTDLRRCLLFSVCFAAALATKLSAVPFFSFGLPVVAVFTLRRRLLWPIRHPLAFVRAAVPHALIFVVVVPVVIWASYGFHLAPPVGREEAGRLSTALAFRHSELASVVGRLPEVQLPLGGFLRGVGVGYNIAKLGHPGYLMGHFALHGWPYYFLVTVLLKVPIGTWIAVFIAFLLGVRGFRDEKGREVLLLLALCAAILASVAGAGINAGHRHVVAVEALFALVVAGGASLAFAEKLPFRPVVVIALMAALLAGSAASLWANTDALGYTNALAGRDPDWWFIDSNLDWGQDLERLHSELAARHVTGEISLAYFGTAEPQRHGIRFHPLLPGEHKCGWVAVSVNYLRGLVGGGIGQLPSAEERNGYAWLRDQTPVVRVGTSIRLYDLDASNGVCAR